MRLKNWHWAILVFVANLVVTWLFGPVRPASVRAAGPPPHFPLPVTSLGGTPNAIPVWTRDFLLGNSLIYQNGSNVGIGTTAPGATLEVQGTAKFDGNVNFAGGLSVPASGLTGIVQIANGGTGISTAPTGDGQYLRGNADGTWSVSTIQPADVPSSMDTLAAFNGSPLMLSAPCPGNCTPNSAPLSFPILYQNQGWTVSGVANSTLTATDTGLVLGFLNLSALTVPGAEPTVLTIEVERNGVDIPGGTFTISSPAGVTQPTTVAWPFLQQAVPGDQFTVLASCGPANEGAICQINQEQISLILFK